MKFEKEPGFFFGSMYVSYALGVGLFLVWWVIQSIFFPEMKAGQMVLIMTVLQIGIAPINLYVSKLTWLNLFVNFNEQYTTEKEQI